MRPGSQPRKYSGRIVKYPLATAIQLRLLHRELNAQMRFRITEPTFFLHKAREIGEIMEAPVGPYRNIATGGGLQRIPQFVQMPDEIKDVIVNAVKADPPVEKQTVTSAEVGTFADATASVLKPAASPKPVSRTASVLTALAGRRRKLEETIITEATAYAKKLGEVEAGVPSTFAKASASLDDRQASLGEIDASLVDFAGANDIDPLSR